MLKLLITASCLLTVSQAFFMPPSALSKGLMGALGALGNGGGAPTGNGGGAPTGNGGGALTGNLGGALSSLGGAKGGLGGAKGGLGGATGGLGGVMGNLGGAMGNLGGVLGNLGGVRRPNPGIIRFGPYTIDVTGLTNIKTICNNALMTMGMKVSDHLSDVMGQAVQYVMSQPGQTLATLGANDPQWQCLVGAVSNGGMQPNGVAGAISDYFDTAAETPIQRYMPPGMFYNPCEMVFCGEQGMTPAAMMMKMMNRLRMRQPLGPMATRVFGPALAQRLNQRTNLLGRLGGAANPMRPTASNAMGTASSNSMGIAGSNAGTFPNSAGTPTNTAGAATTNLGTPTGGNAGTPSNNMGPAVNTAGTPAGNAGAATSNMGTPASSAGTPVNSMGTPASNTGTSGAAGNIWQEMMRKVSGFGQSSGLAGMTNTNTNTNNNNNLWAQMASSMMSKMAQSSSPMLQNMMNRFNPPPPADAAASNTQSTNTNPVAGLPGMGTFNSIMNAMNTMSALERMQDPPERSPFMRPMGMMPSFNPTGGAMAGLGGFPAMGAQQNGGQPATGNTGSGGGMGMLGDMFRMLG